MQHPALTMDSLYIVDAFTNRPFRGNPAAVCLLTGPAEERWMQRLAAEMNLSETAFVRQSGDEFELRWFTPKLEVDLCGHATLAAAHVLYDEGIVPQGTGIRFRTRSGVLRVTPAAPGSLEAIAASRDAERRVGEAPWLEMDFPREDAHPAEAPEEMLQALAVVPRYVGRNRFDYLIEVASEDELEQLRVDFRRLLPLVPRGLIVTAASARDGIDFVSRFFAPAAGIDEDPVTGSAHCCLGPFWAARLGKMELVGMQVSQRRGIVWMRVGEERVLLGGQAVTVLRGRLSADALHSGDVAH